jgi:uncharacterized protein YxeA
MAKKIITFVLSVVIIILSLAILKNPEVSGNSMKVLEKGDNENKYLSKRRDH